MFYIDQPQQQIDEILATYGEVMPPLKDNFKCRLQRQLCYRILAAHQGVSITVHHEHQMPFCDILREPMMQAG